MTGTVDHVRRNRAAWDQWADEYAGPDLRPAAGFRPAWGCGTGYVSAWLARRGPRPVGVDHSAAQLANASQGDIRLWSDRSEAWGEQDAMWVCWVSPGFGSALATSAATEMAG
ncbi:MAG: class I SAM-dependent methyltransferase [Streptosporangiaceae bacterium]